MKKNNILSLGWNNSLKTHPIAKKFGYRFSGIHSELHCLLNAKTIDFSRCYMINVRLGEKKALRQSKPCEPCQRLLIHYGINKVVYSVESGFDLWQNMMMCS